MSEEHERYSSIDVERAEHTVESDNVPLRHLSQASIRAHTFPALSRDEQARLYEFCGRVGLFGDRDFADKQHLQDLFRKRLRSGLLRCFRRQKVKLVYELACDGYEWSRLWYYVSRITIMGCLVLQIGIASTITVMGAYNHFMIPVVVLGAINAALAALLALMKGMNLTKSTYQTMNELEAVIDFINRTVKEFEYGGRVEIDGRRVDLDAFQQAQIAWEMYNEAIKNHQASHKDPEQVEAESSNNANTRMGITPEQRTIGITQIRHRGKGRNTWFSHIDW